MKKVMFAVAALALAFVSEAATTNVVTNVVWESRVEYTPRAITNSYRKTFSGTVQYTNIIDSIMEMWPPTGTVVVTNSHRVAIAGTVTNKVYDIKWLEKPRHYFVPVTNIFNRITF